MSPVMALLLFVAVCAALMAGFPVAFTLAGVALIFAGLGAMTGTFDPSFLEAVPNRLYGIMTNETLIAVPLFVFMGVMLERSKVAEDLLNTLARLFGGLRGGLGFAVLIVGMLMAASTGIVGATVVTMGLLSLPTMLKKGYDPSLATGTICAAGTLGQIIPPSIVLVLLGDVISNAYQQAQISLNIFSPKTISVGDLFVGALIPGLGLVVLYLLYVAGVAFFQPHKAPVMPAEERGKINWFELIGALVPPLALMVMVLGSIIAGVATPTEAAAVGAVGAIVLAAFERKMIIAALSVPIAWWLLWQIHDGLLGLANPIAGKVAFWLGFSSPGLPLLIALILAFKKQFKAIAAVLVAALTMAGLILANAWLLGAAGVLIAITLLWKKRIPLTMLTEVMRTTVQVTAMVFMILIGAAIFSLVFRGFGGDAAVHSLLSQLPGGTAGAVIVVMLVMFLLGFVLDFLEITFVVVPIVGPVLLAMGLDPVWLGVMIAINLQTSFLTPPFGFALFYLRGVAPNSIRTSQIYRGVLPFIIIQLLMLGILAAWPELVTWLPNVWSKN